MRFCWTTTLVIAVLQIVIFDRYAKNVCLTRQSVQNSYLSVFSLDKFLTLPICFSLGYVNHAENFTDNYGYIVSEAQC